MNAWAIAAKNLLEDKTCDKCRWIAADPKKCTKAPRPQVHPSIEPTLWPCPTIRTCPLWEKMWA